MDPIGKVQMSYRVEVSGWDASENFFVEKTTLDWRGGDQKEISLQVRLREGCMLFIRLLQPPAAANNIPIAYQVSKVKKDDKGRTRFSLAQIRPRGKHEIAEAWPAPRMTA